jgi:hypothetical protein
MSNPLAPFFRWLNGKRAERAMRIAERQRTALMAQIADRKAHRAEWRPMVGMLRQSTNASLAASCGRKAVR